MPRYADADSARERDEAGIEEVIDADVVEEARNLPAVRASEAMVARDEVSAEDVVGQREKIKQVMDLVMVENVHYGKVPGVSKPTLLKPGAEVLAVTFRLAPSYASERIFDGAHLTVFSKATLTHIPTGLVIAEGEGLCSSRESKYAYRQGGRLCPNCGADAIKKSKFPPKVGDYEGAQPSDAPGWYCFGKIGGCGANFAATDPRITDQSIERVENPDLPDTWNTVLKMGNKRALVAAILNGTAASDIFTQDVEDLPRGSADPYGSDREDAAAGGQAAKIKRDLEAAFQFFDKQREDEPGTTGNAAINWATSEFGLPWDELSGEQYALVGEHLKAWGSSKEEQKSTFAAYLDARSVPFG